MDISMNMIILIIPLVLIQLALIIICLIDWLKRKSFRYLPKMAWLPIFLFIQFIGPACYLLLGRKDEYHNNQEAE